MKKQKTLGWFTGLIRKPTNILRWLKKIYLDDYVSDLDDSLFLPIKDLYLKAIDIDPDYMDALAGLANLYYTYGQFGGSMEIDFVKADSILNVAYQKDRKHLLTFYI